MPEVCYVVDVVDGVWGISLNGKRFGPYSSLDAAMTAASAVAHKAEVQGYEASVIINTPEDAPIENAVSDVA